MKRILNIIGIFFLSIIVFTSCQKSPEELNEGSPQTRAAGVTGTYYWYNGEKIYLTPKNDKQFILFKTSDANSLSSLFTASGHKQGGNFYAESCAFISFGANRRKQLFACGGL